MNFSFQKASFLRVFAEIIFMLQVLYLACFLSFDWMSGAFWRDALGHAEQIAPETLFRWWVPFLLLLAINAVFCSFCLKKRLWSFGKKITFSVVSVAASLFQIYAVVATISSYCANKALLLPLILYISVGCGDLYFRAVWLVAWIALEKQIKAERKGADGIASVCLMSEAAFAIWFLPSALGQNMNLAVLLPEGVSLTAADAFCKNLPLLIWLLFHIAICLLCSQKQMWSADTVTAHYICFAAAALFPAIELIHKTVTGIKGPQQHTSSAAIWLLTAGYFVSEVIWVFLWRRRQHNRNIAQK